MVLCSSGERVNKYDGYVVNRADAANDESRVIMVSVDNGNDTSRGNTNCFYYLYSMYSYNGNRVHQIVTNE
jgi:hypothetical protein